MVCDGIQDVVEVVLVVIALVVVVSDAEVVMLSEVVDVLDVDESAGGSALDVVVTDDVVVRPGSVE